MRNQRRYKRPITTRECLMAAWLDAAEKWRRLQSDPALREVLRARAAYYQEA